MKPKKSLGQNFLRDTSVVDIMIESLNIKDNDEIIEIGGGRGALTKKLIKIHKGKIMVYEIDSVLAENLKKLAVGYENRIKIFNEDFLRATLPLGTKKYKIIGSIPYYITSPILHKILKTKIRPQTVVLLIQKEVAEKILKRAPQSNYWSYITLGYKIRKIVNVPKTLFYPVPKVDGTVILMHVDDSKKDLVKKINFTDWENFLHYTYKYPRKMLNKRFSRSILEVCGISPMNRPHDLKESEILLLFKCFKDCVVV